MRSRREAGLFWRLLRNWWSRGRRDPEGLRRAHSQAEAAREDGDDRNFGGGHLFGQARDKGGRARFVNARSRGLVADVGVPHVASGKHGAENA